ncbi:MAG: ABC transporter ATP-binding protein [Gemmatimonadota bacterium]
MSIRLVGLHKSFGTKTVLDGVDLEVAEGGTVAVMGSSGVGKSVLLKHVVGLLRPDRGEIWVDGDNVNGLSGEGLRDLRRKVGYVFQFAALFDSLTIADNICLGLRRLPDWDDARIRERVEECLHLVDLEGYGERFPAQLSGGQRKRAGLARAIATRPRYLLYDEPTTGLDPVTTTVIDRLIMRMRDELGVTSVVITHDLTSAFRVSDRVAMLHDGRIRFFGTPQEIQEATDPVVRGFVAGLPELFEEAT